MGEMADRELLEAAWRQYEDRFAEHVGEVVSPEDHVDGDEQIDWAAQVFMFAYGLGSIAGAAAVAPGTVADDGDGERVENIVDAVIEIHASDEFAASASRIREDLIG